LLFAQGWGIPRRGQFALAALTVLAGAVIHGTVSLGTLDGPDGFSPITAVNFVAWQLYAYGSRPVLLFGKPLQNWARR